MPQRILSLLTFCYAARCIVCGSADVDHLELLQRGAANLDNVEHEIDEETEDELEGSSCVKMPWGQSCPGNQAIHNPSDCLRCGQQLGIWRFHGQGNWRDDLRGCEAVHGGIGYNFGGHHTVHSIPGGYGAQRQALAVCKAAPTPYPTPPPTPPPTPEPTPTPTPSPTPSPTEAPTEAPTSETAPESPSASPEANCKTNWDLWKRQRKCWEAGSTGNGIKNGVSLTTCRKFADSNCHQFISYRADLKRCMTHAKCPRPEADQATRWNVFKQTNEACQDQCSNGATDGDDEDASDDDDDGDDDDAIDDTDDADDSEGDDVDEGDDDDTDGNEDSAPAPAPTGVCRSKCFKQQNKFLKKGKEILVWKKVCSKSFCADCPFCAEKPDELPSPAPTGICKSKCNKQYDKFVKKGKEGLGFQRVCKKSFCRDCEFCSGNFPTPAPTSPCKDGCQEKYDQFAKKGKESEGVEKVCAKFSCSGDRKSVV